ncbi:MAG: ABC transporter substrate-binding protein [Pseudomonadota bacterium]
MPIARPVQPRRGGHHPAALLLCLWLALPGVAAAGQVEMQAIVYPPLVYASGDRLWGVVPEVVREIQHIVGDDSKLKEVPWLRAFEQAKTEPMHALFAIVRIPEREPLFKWVGPVFDEGDYFFKRKGSPLEIKSLEDAKAVGRIAARKDGYTHKAMAASGFTNLDIGPTYDSSYRKLHQGRVDLVLMGERTYRYMVGHAGLDPEDFERTDYLFNESSAWLAFSRDVPNELVERWQQALDTIKANGVYDAILDRNFAH